MLRGAQPICLSPLRVPHYFRARLGGEMTDCIEQAEHEEKYYLHEDIGGWRSKCAVRCRTGLQPFLAIDDEDSSAFYAAPANVEFFRETLAL